MLQHGNDQIAAPISVLNLTPVTVSSILFYSMHLKRQFDGNEADKSIDLRNSLVYVSPVVT